MKRVNAFRIKRTFDYVGKDDQRVTIDVLQQLWMHTDGSGLGIWKDVPVVEIDNDHFKKSLRPKKD